LDDDKHASVTMTLITKGIINSVLDRDKQTVQEEESGDEGEEATRVSWQTA
jgi:hypothetical protein